MKFIVNLAKELVRNIPNWYGVENWDTEILPYRESITDKVFNFARKLLNKLFNNYIISRKTDFSYIIDYFDSLESILPGLTKTYHLLNDEYSRELFIILIVHRKMGHHKVMLPLNNLEYWNLRNKSTNLAINNDIIQVTFRDYLLRKMKLNEIGYPINIYCNPISITAIFMLKQYEYQKLKTQIKAREGDYVIDGGGCWGDASLYFAHEVGNSGKVYSFEFCEENLKIFYRNLELNREYSNRIEIIPHPLWSISGEEVAYSVNGPATFIGNKELKLSRECKKVSTISIDDFIRKNNLPKIDFIKMDIEGAELKALQGAELTLRTHKPKLAISIYHQDSDFIDIPAYLDSLNLGYKFYLDHFTIYRSETVLFAIKE